MLLLLGRRVPLSLYRLTTGCPASSLPSSVLISSALIKLTAITRVTHSTVFVSGQNTGTMPERRPFVRLPADVYPVNYGLCLKPDLIDFTFEGKLEAVVEVTQATNQIVMNCADIDIITASFAPQGGEEINATGFNYQNEDEKVTLSFPSALQKGAGTLKVDFVGELNDKMKGFYRSKYSNAAGESATLPSHSSRAFPCWDEPAIKATFDITLIVPNRVALSNMFATTPIMSTYLVAFVIGEYDFVEAQSSDGITVRVYTPVGKSEQGKFALEVATKTLPFYNDYFNVPYPLPKIDLIAIADFAAGAMENWGLVTYRETALLIDPKNSCSSSRQWVALVEWWTHLWLNEGFASWIEYLCVDHCFPEYDIWTQFVSADYTRALDLDALDSSHPIEVNVGHPSEVDEIFDAISYSKGASVIRMLHDYTGDEDFRKGMNAYLLKFQHKNACTEDLWDCLEQASGKPIAEVMSSWTKQMGFPIIEQGDDRIVKLSQKKFCASGPHSGLPQLDGPHQYFTSEDPTCSKLKVLLDRAETTITLSGVPTEQWIKINPGTVGFYRIQYSSSMLERLLPGVRDLSLQPVDRLGLQNDLFSLSRAGMITVQVLTLMEAFVNEPNYTCGATSAVTWAFCPRCCRTPTSTRTSRSSSETSSPPSAWSWAGTASQGKLGKAGHKPTLEEARRRFRDHVDGKQVYLTVLKHGDSATLETMMKLHKLADMQEERNRIERVLGAISAPDLIQKVLTFALSEEVRPQDTVLVIGGVADSSKQGRKAAWKFVKDNWEELYNRYQGGFLISRLIKLTVNGFAIDKMAAEIKCCENILLNAAWLKRDADDISQYLLKRKGPPPAEPPPPPSARTSQHLSCPLPSPTTDQSVRTAGFISLKKLEMEDIGVFYKTSDAVIYLNVEIILYSKKRESEYNNKKIGSQHFSSRPFSFCKTSGNASR
ncbi:hypothetical protein F7725_006092 [Dissostichus mawsoni]|uniref:Aminopeptidase n=1 Tax=Dissostichus mawsoni TaxID=36200 RepID=A0A7J5YW50_DISMA|nr:hypothetical protein F7725_006092 [Dissostichus mawsoni]